MFGLLLGILNLGGLAVGGIKQQMDDDAAKKRTYNPDTQTYLDSHGVERNVYTNNRVYLRSNGIDDTILYDEEGHILRNYSAERRKAKRVTNEEHKKYITVKSLNQKNWTYYDQAIGYYVQDLKDHSIYTQRYLYIPEFCCNIQYYMNIYNGKLIRLTDEQKLRIDLNNQKKVWYPDRALADKYKEKYNEFHKQLESSKNSWDQCRYYGNYYKVDINDHNPYFNPYHIQISYSQGVLTNEFKL